MNFGAVGLILGRAFLVRDTVSNSWFCGKIRYMAVLDIYSKRQRRIAGNPVEVYEYDVMPEALRIQIICILRDVIGHKTSHPRTYDVYEVIHNDLAREYGVEELDHDPHSSPSQKLFAFIRKTDSAARVLDAVEVSFAYAKQTQSAYYNASAKVEMSVGDAVDEINHRFLEAAVGYQYESDQIIRIDSQFVHAEIVKPALTLLSDQCYEGAQEEFLNAHKHYREGNYKETLTDSLKAFESTLKTICEIRKWPYSKTDTARTLIDTCFKNGLIPAMLQSQFNSLQSVLGSGVPTLRNKMSGHGQGAVPTAVPSYLAAYTLHLTAANIVFLLNAAKP